jgi:hypothetical protein
LPDITPIPHQWPDFRVPPSTHQFWQDTPPRTGPNPAPPVGADRLVMLVAAVAMVALFVALVVVNTYGWFAFLVALAAFWMIAVTTATALSHVVDRSDHPKLEWFQIGSFILAGTALGSIAATLVLTTPSGQSLVEWVKGSTWNLLIGIFGVALSTSIGFKGLKRLLQALVTPLG